MTAVDHHGSSLDSQMFAKVTKKLESACQLFDEEQKIKLENKLVAQGKLRKNAETMKKLHSTLIQSKVDLLDAGPVLDNSLQKVNAALTSFEKAKEEQQQQQLVSSLPSSIDDTFIAADIWNLQLAESIAEDQAFADILPILQQALRIHSIDLATFLKSAGMKVEQEIQQRQQKQHQTNNPEVVCSLKQQNVSLAKMRAGGGRSLSSGANTNVLPDAFQRYVAPSSSSTHSSSSSSSSSQKTNSSSSLYPAVCTLNNSSSSSTSVHSSLLYPSSLLF